MGAVVTVLLYSRQFSAPLEQIAGVMGSVQRTCAAARRVYEMRDAPEEEPIEGHLPEEIKGDVDFENVKFQLRSRNAADSGLHCEGKAWAEGGHCRAHRRGQDHAGEPADAVL